MSDNTNNGTSSANQGITLPEAATATHSISLSPLFIIRSGRGTHAYAPDYAVVGRGSIGYLWSITTHSHQDWVYYLAITTNVYPSDQYIQSWVQSLRCLVSTTNS